MGISKGGHGIGGWMGDENDFCMVMNMAVPFGYFLLFSATGVAQKMKYLGFLGSFILAAMASLSRGGFFGLASVGVYCWYRSPKKLNALIVVVVAVVFMLVLAPATYWDEIASSTSDETMGSMVLEERDSIPGVLEWRCFSITQLSELGRVISHGRLRCMRPAEHFMTDRWLVGRRIMPGLPSSLS